MYFFPIHLPIFYFGDAYAIQMLFNLKNLNKPYLIVTLYKILI